MKKWWIAFFCIICTLTSTAQDQEFDFENFVQTHLPQPEEDADYTQWYETLLQFHEHPIDLNNTSREQLQQLQLLSEIQINHLLTHIEKNGALLSIHELQAVESFDKITLLKIMPFVKVSPVTDSPLPLLKRIREEKNTFLILRGERGVQQKEGYRKGTYAGSPNELLLRFRSSHPRDFSLGFTLQKDAGEKSCVDFYSAHLLLHRPRLSIIMGDYQLQAGQGLVFSAGLNLGKGAEPVLSARRSFTGFRPYTSIVEAGFMRGTAVSYQLHKNLRLSGFVSSARRDALTDSTQTTALSLPVTGFHRTASEVSHRKRISEFSFGNHLFYDNRKNLQLGLSFISTHYSLYRAPLPRSYNQFYFRGRSNEVTGFHWSYNFQNIGFFGEVARSAGGGTGAIAGITANLSTSAEAVLLWRRYDRNFHSFYGLAFGENSTNQNERGIYAGFKYRINRQWSAAAFCDQFRFPWLRYQVSAPSQGYEILTRLNYQPSRTVQMYAQFRHRSKEKDQAEAKITAPVPALKNNCLFSLDYRAEKHLRLRSKVQWSSYKHGNAATTKGYAIVQDAMFEHKKIRFTARFALFDTDDFENRQYVFENDVLGAFSFPAYQGRGFRNYYLLQFPIGRQVDLWLRYACTLYRDREEIGSGMEKIRGNVQSEVKMQVRWRMGSK